MSGGFDKLDGGFPSIGWLVLTGCEDQHVLAVYLFLMLFT
jgi:hypothetical protein